MTILKIYGGPHASSTRRVATVLHELKVPFELITFDLVNGEHKTLPWLEKQPFGQTPYIDDAGFILYETRAICRYIAAKYLASGLIPGEPKANALFEQAAAVELTNWDAYATKIVFEAVVKPKYGWPNDMAEVARLLEVLDKKLDAYNVILGKQRYIAGETLTLADLFHILIAPRMAEAGIDIMTRKPNVARWYKELIARPSWLAYPDGVKTTTSY
ncbi:glutathione S-transferase [Mycena capillaripes]|nr:glutathione S-transferase [Mycena capillaripes]